MPGRQFGRDPLHLDEGDQVAVDPDPVVGELALDLVLGGQVGVLVEPALAWRPGQARPEITSTLLASPGTVASMFSLRGAHETRARSNAESRVVNGMPYQ